MLPLKALLTHAVEEALAYVQGESLKASAALLARLINSPITRTGMQMRTCSKCHKVYADKFSRCPHCNRGGRMIAGLLLAGVCGAGLWGMLSGQGSVGPPPKWEVVSGIQQGIRVVSDIDENSIQRTSDGASATVDVKVSDTVVEKFTYICRVPDPALGMHGGVIRQNNLTDLPYGSTGESIMKRVCFGPLPQEVGK